MVRPILLLAALLAGGERVAAQGRVEMRGITAEMKLEEPVYGHLPEIINGKFKMRATEVTFAPGAFLGAHHHAGPGIRYVLSGEVAFTQAGLTTIYKAGEYFSETGNIVHTAENRASEPLRILFVELLPRDWSSPTVILPRN